MLHAEPVQTAEEFFEELLSQWQRKSLNTALMNGDEYELIRRTKPKVRSGTWFLYENEDADDASKLYEKGNE